MSIETDIWQKLANSTSAVGVSQDKIYQNFLPIGLDLPAISFYRVSTVPVHAMGSDPKLRESRWQFSCWSTSPSQAASIAEGVISTLRDFTGNLTGSTTGVSVQRVFFDDKQSFQEVDPETNRVTYHNPVDMIFWSTEG